MFNTILKAEFCELLGTINTAIQKYHAAGGNYEFEVAAPRSLGSVTVKGPSQGVMSIIGIVADMGHGGLKSVKPCE